MSIATRIKAARTEAGMTQEGLAKEIGVTKGAIANYENGVSVPKIDLLYQLMRVLQIDANYVFQDEMQTIAAREIAEYTKGEKKIIEKYRSLDDHGKEAVEGILNIECARMERIISGANSDGDENVIYLPEPIQSASAGTGELADDDTANMVGVYYNPSTAKADCIIRVHGDSMEPKICDGDRVLVRCQPAVEIGEIGVFINDGERFVKIRREGYLESINPAYASIPFRDDIRCIGKAIDVLKEEWIAK